MYWEITSWGAHTQIDIDWKESNAAHGGVGSQDKFTIIGREKDLPPNIEREYQIFAVYFFDVFSVLAVAYDGHNEGPVHRNKKLYPHFF